VRCADPGCAYPLRNGRTRAADAPGTRQASVGGLCKTCYHQARKARPILTPKQLASARNALDGWLKQRHNRLGKEAPCANTAKPSKKQPTNSNKCGVEA
jgi:hypothetical protein